nr:hypothetical protein [Saprospiraceae bacterium]
NWYGLYCPDCGGVIPCIRNYTAALLLGITFPFRIWSYSSRKAKWLAKQPARYEDVNIEEIESGFERKKWILEGLGLGLFLFLIHLMGFPLLTGESMDWSFSPAFLTICLMGGLLYGYLMKWYHLRRRKEVS